MLSRGILFNFEQNPVFIKYGFAGVFEAIQSGKKVQHQKMLDLCGGIQLPCLNIMNIEQSVTKIRGVCRKSFRNRRQPLQREPLQMRGMVYEGFYLRRKPSTHYQSDNPVCNPLRTVQQPYEHGYR